MSDRSVFYRAADAERDERHRALDRHERERGVLFENEALAVKSMQAVSGASMIGAIAQTKALTELAGVTSFLLFLTAMGVALIAAVIAIHAKHQYKMWDVKAAAVEEQGERNRRQALSAGYLKGMRSAMWVALISISVGFAQLLIALWRSA